MYFLKKIKFEARNLNGGMTYIELAIVLSIFAIISSVSIFNYKEFQAKIDLKNTATQIALKILEAQKNSVSGKLAYPNWKQPISNWKPSYSVYFNLNYIGKVEQPPNNYVGDTIFYTTIDLNNDKSFGFDFSKDICSNPNTSNECLDKFTLSKGVYIENVNDNSSGGPPLDIKDNADFVNIVFTRPQSGAFFCTLPANCNVSWGLTYLDIVLKSIHTSAESIIRVWPSGRIEIK